MRLNEPTKRLYECARTGDLAKATAAISAGADINASNELQSAPLHVAVFNGHIDIARLLIDKGAKVDPRNKHNATPLHWAASRGRIDIARLLIEGGADPNARDDSRYMPLDYALQARSSDLITLLQPTVDAPAKHAERIPQPRKSEQHDPSKQGRHQSPRREDQDLAHSR